MAKPVVVADLPVFRDELGENPAGWFFRAHFFQQFTNSVHHFDILFFVMAADVIGFIHRAFFYHLIQSTCMIIHIQPVPHLIAFAVNWQRLAG